MSLPKAKNFEVETFIIQGSSDRTGYKTTPNVDWTDPIVTKQTHFWTYRPTINPLLYSADLRWTGPTPTLVCTDPLVRTADPLVCTADPYLIVQTHSRLYIPAHPRYRSTLDHIDPSNTFKPHFRLYRITFLLFRPYGLKDNSKIGHIHLLHSRRTFRLLNVYTDPHLIVQAHSRLYRPTHLHYRLNLDHIDPLLYI